MHCLTERCRDVIRIRHLLIREEEEEGTAMVVDCLCVGEIYLTDRGGYMGSRVLNRKAEFNTQYLPREIDGPCCYLCHW